MAAIPSVVIGLGTSGCEIVAATYQEYKAYCQRAGENEEIVQFLTIDTQNPVAGGEELYAMGNHLMIGVPNADKLRKAKWELDLFFREWWPEDYVSIGRLYPSAQSLPLKGKLAYWGGIGRPGAQKYFGQKFLECMERSFQAYAATGVPRYYPLQVYLVCTLSGGTGSGIFLDVAQTIANLDLGIDTFIYGVFILPDVIKMRAENARHEQIGANGYGALIALNYWSTERDFRDPDIGDFMIIDDKNTITGDKSPIDISWLIGRQNRNGLSLRSWNDYKDLVVSTLSMQCFEDYPDNIRERVIGKYPDWLGTCTGGAKPQPRNYGSFACYRLRYHPERAARYLTADLKVRALEKILEEQAVTAGGSPQEFEKWISKNGGLGKEAAAKITVMLEKFLPADGIKDSILHVLLEPILREAVAEKKWIYPGNKVRADLVVEEPAILDGQALSLHFQDDILANLSRGEEEIIRGFAAGLLLSAEKQGENPSLEYCLREEIRQKMELLGESCFHELTRGVTIWEALQISSLTAGDGNLAAYMEERLGAAHAAAQPFWQVDQATYNYVVGPIHRTQVISYDEEALSQFESSLGVNISREYFRNANTGTASPQAAADLSDEAYKPSPYEYKLLVLEAGVPLQFVQNIEPHKTEFLERTAKTDIPVLSDARLNQLIDMVGLPTWDLALQKVSEEEEKNLVILLMLEHFGVMISPLVKKHQTSGRYQLGDQKLHKSTRYYAFLKALELIHEDRSWWEEQQIKYKDLRNHHSPADWRFEHMVCYQRLRKVLGLTPMGNVKDALTEQLNNLKRLIRSNLMIDTAEILENDPQIQKRLEQETG